MYSSNPYSQGWSETASSAGNGQSGPGSWGYGGGAPPSVFGALPYPTPASFPTSSSELTTLYFTTFCPTILNCTVVGPQSRPFYRITTDSSMPGYTVWKDTENRNVALVEWQAHPAIEIRGLVPKQPAQNWLRLSRDRSYRTMEINGHSYIWAPSPSGHLCLYTKASAQMLARVTKFQGHVTLELTSQAVQLGLLQASAVATVLLQCGRNID